MKTTKIHILIGTKAQLIKMGPLMEMLQERSIPYRFIFTGQHQETVEKLRENFHIKEPDVTLHYGKDVKSLPYMLYWLIKILFTSVIKHKHVFGSEPSGIVLVHGDTFSCLLGALLGKLKGLKIGHVESGLRSFNLFHPFPEELTRILVFRLTDIFYCPGNWAVKNVERYDGIKINTHMNTLFDSLNRAVTIQDRGSTVTREKPYCIVSMHRFENLCQQSVLMRNIELIKTIALRMKVLFILHPVTLKRLLKTGLYNRLQQTNNIELCERLDYFGFIHLLIGSEFIVTDGGGNQEEAFYLGKPCLLLRRASERQEGIGQNTVISNYAFKRVSNFLDNYHKYRQDMVQYRESPTEIILNHLKTFL